GANALIARELTEIFKSRFDPNFPDKNRESALQEKRKTIEKLLESVQNLDEDRILRRYLDAIMATMRTNFYQRDDQDQPKTYISFKFNPKKIPELPRPIPKHEIFVYS